MINEKEQVLKTVFTNVELTPLVFDLYCTLNDIKKIESVKSVYLNISSYKLEIYVFYEKENFDVEDKIIELVANFEMQYLYFPEVFIEPLDMIERKELILPQSAREV